MKERTLFGVGHEKSVFEDPHHPERLMKESNGAINESPATVKGRFYLTKLLHRLFPANVPDIHAVTSAQPQSMTVEKKVLDTHHQELRRLDMGLHQGSLSDDERLRFFRLEKQYRNEPAFKRLAMILSGVGVRVDASGTNFGFDNRGEPVYIDSFLPWSGTSMVGTGIERFKRRYDPMALAARIQLLPEDQRSLAQRDFQRLEALYLEEEHRIRDSLA